MTPDQLAAKGQWIARERESRGWSAEALAQRALSYARAYGYSGDLKQQTISKFENSGGKRVPAWLRYVEMALTDAPLPTVKLPSVETIATILEAVLSAEKAGQAPKGDLTIYGTLVRNVLFDVASGDLVETDQDAIRREMSDSIRKAFGGGPALPVS